MNYNFDDTIGGQLINQLRIDMMEAIEVPNEYLPEAYRNHRDGGHSLAELDAMLTPPESIPDAKQLEATAKAERVEQYRQQQEDGEAIDYNVNEYKLYRMQQAFIKGAERTGMLHN